MAKDYAKASFKTTRARRQRSHRIFYSFMFGFLLLGISSIFAWYVYQNGMVFNKEKINNLLAEMKATFHHPKAQPVISDNIKSETVAAEAPDVHFDFYTELPHMQVTLPATQDELNKAVPPVIRSPKKNSSVIDHSIKKEESSIVSVTNKKNPSAIDYSIKEESATASVTNAVKKNLSADDRSARDESVIASVTNAVKKNLSADDRSVRNESVIASIANADKKDLSSVDSSVNDEPAIAGVTNMAKKDFSTVDGSIKDESSVVGVSNSVKKENAAAKENALRAASVQANIANSLSASTGQYIVQLGAYKNDSTASGMRVSILLAGFDVKVVKTIKNKQTIYRIQQGPYQTLTQAKNAQKNLQAKGFDGVIQKLN